MAKETLIDFKHHIGFSPAGVEWVAYKPERVEPMTERLAQRWQSHNQQIVRVGGLTTAQVDWASLLIADYVEFDQGATWISAPREDLQVLAEDLECHADEGDHEAEIGGNHLQDTGLGLLDHQVAQRVECLKTVAWKIRSRLQ